MAEKRKNLELEKKKNYLRNHDVDQIRVLRMKKGAFGLKKKEDALVYFEELGTKKTPIFNERKEKTPTVAKDSGNNKTFLLFEFDKEIVAAGFMSKSGPRKAVDSEGEFFKYDLKAESIVVFHKSIKTEEMGRKLKINFSLPHNFPSIRKSLYDKIITCLFSDGEPSEKIGYEEGAIKRVYLDVHERNKQARAECIEYYGYNCFVCGFDFNEKYGELGENYIHVHHLIPMSENDKKRKVDPIKDLRPVCPNCHSMIHIKKDPISILKLKKIVESRKNAHKK